MLCSRAAIAHSQVLLGTPDAIKDVLGGGEEQAGDRSPETKKAVEVIELLDSDSDADGDSHSDSDLEIIAAAPAMQEGVEKQMTAKREDDAPAYCTPPKRARLDAGGSGGAGGSAAGGR